MIYPQSILDLERSEEIYCLDANVLIEAWQHYYSPDFCKEYWERLNELGLKRRIFIPEAVRDEVLKTEDDLASWLKKSDIRILNLTGNVTKCLQSIYAKDPIHYNLVDNMKYRSLADPWLIAHAMDMNATVVTKESMVTASNKRIRIPNVCQNMGIKCINDYQFIREIGINFDCKI